MLSKVKLTGVVLTALAGACLATHRANLRRRAEPRSVERDPFLPTDPAKPQQVETRMDAGNPAL
ncbi:MAG TPA: hypothetical protein VMN83_22405 [Albitalea sp.]|nr:hypothetical protein [Albitalea sp.]